MARTEIVRRRRVVVTGCGVISPVGHDTATFWASLVDGRSGIGRITRFDPSDLPVTIAGEVRDFDPEAYMPRTVSRRIDRFAQYALAAAVEAVESAKLDITDEMAPRVGVIIGSGYGPGSLIQAAARTLAERGPRRVGAYLAAAGAADSAAGEIAFRFGACGPSGAVSTACASGATAIGDAMRMIEFGHADVVIAGGADDPLTPLDIAAAAIAGALARRNDEPERASRPFDRDRTGFVLAAGAGVVVLEEAEHAQRRGAPILGEILGYGASTDVHHLTAPHPEGKAAQRAMRAALADAGIAPDEIDYINAHATGTRRGDSIECAAIRAVFGAHATRIPISSTKSVTGHMIGAAGAVELIATLQAIRTCVVPPTINCDDPEDPELDHVPHRARQWPVRTAMSNSFGFSGHNAVLVVRRWEP